MISIIVTQILMTLLSSLLIYYLDSQVSAVSFLAGSALSLVNLVLLVWLLRRIFEKKQVALSGVIIIFKYLILGLIIYFVINQTNLNGLWFGAGLILVLVTLVLQYKKLELEIDRKVGVL